MANLLPQHARRKLQKTYWVRVGAVWAFAVSIVLFYVLCLLLPTYVLLKKQQAIISTNVQTQKDDITTMDNVSATIREANAFAVALVNDGSSVRTMSQVVDALMNVLPESITLEGYSIIRDEDGAVTTLKLSGIAATRDDVALFRTALEQHPMFTDSQLPLKSLVQDVELPFTMTVSISEQVMM